MSYCEFTSRPIYNFHPLLVVITRSKHWTIPCVQCTRKYYTALAISHRHPQRGKFISRILQATVNLCTPALFVFFSVPLLYVFLGVQGWKADFKQQTNLFNLIILCRQITPNFSFTFTGFTPCFSPILSIALIILWEVSRQHKTIEVLHYTRYTLQ
jgi:uncharacterized membrane protein